MRLIDKIKRSLIKAYQWLNDDLRNPTHPQIEFIPPIILRLLFIVVLLIVVTQLLKQLFEYLIH